MKKKIVVILAAVLILSAAGAFGAFKLGYIGSVASGDGDSEIYVSSLSSFMGIGQTYNTDVFMGVVEGQATTGITKASDREIDEVFVAVGDSVSKGDKLFSYKTSSVNDEITQYGFDIEEDKLTIADYNRQLTSLTNTLNKTSNAEDREDLQNQIEGINTQIAICQNSIDQTNAKITEAKKKIENSVVYATSNGQITKIQSESDTVSSDGSFITMLASKEMRVKGTINEQNVWSINIDTPVTLRSRIDKTKTWTGTITKIDTESKVENNNDSYSDSSSSDNSSTNYPFYVTLDNSEGLMMGQHLYIELGELAAPEVDFTSGTYIYDYLIAYDEEQNPFVWKMGKGSKLVKAYVTLGEYNENLGVYEITDGVTYEDSLAYPMDDYTEGMHCVSDAEVK